MHRTMFIVTACSIFIVNACIVLTIHACIKTMNHACKTLIARACTLGRLFACVTAIVHVPCLVEVMFHTVEALDLTDLANVIS